jgi:hypothetical protein
VPDELRHVVGDEEHLQAFREVGPLLERVPGDPVRFVDVLVGDAGGGVHGVHDHVGPAPGDELVEEVLRGRGLGEGLDQALDEGPAPGGIAEDLRARQVLEVGEGEDVAPGRAKLHHTALRLQGPDRLLGLVLLQGKEGEPAGRLAQQPSGGGLTHEPVAAQDEDALPAKVHARPGYAGTPEAPTPPARAAP